MSKRTIILASVALIIILGVALFLVVSKNKVTTPPSQGNSSPFGEISGNIPNATTTVESSGPTSFGSNGGQAKLIRISGAPIAGSSIYNQNGNAIARFIERATGYIFDYNLGLGALIKVSNTSLPHLVQTSWAKNGDSLITQYLSDTETINTYSGSIVADTHGSSTKVFSKILQGRLLQEGITAVAISPNGTKIFYLVPGGQGVEGYTATSDGSKPVKIFSSPVTEFLVSWPQQNTIILTTKASAGVSGYVYALNASNGSVTQLLGGVAGLTALVDPTVTKIAYTDDSMALKIFTIKTGAIVDTGVQTLAEKCVWSTKQSGTLYCAVPNTLSSNVYPDSWYQGLVSFADSIVKIDGSTSFLSKPQENYGQAIDAETLSLSPNEDYLIFTNKRDYTLWALSLN